MSPQVSSSSARHGQVGICDRLHTRISPLAVPLSASVGGENASSPSPPASLQHVTGSPWPTHRPIWRSHSNPTPCSGVPLARGGRPNIARS